MTTDDIEQLFKNELGIDEVCVYSYDEENKLIDMDITIDFENLDIDNSFYLKSINKFGLPYQAHIDFNNDRKLKQIRINFKDNKFQMFVDNDFPNEIEEIFFEYLEEFFLEQFKDGAKAQIEGE